MLTGGEREESEENAGLTAFAAKAKDLGALRDAVVDAASVSTGLWLSYLFVLFYFAIAAGAVTHRDLFLENPVKLPFLNVELPLKAFFVLGPLVFVVVHAYVLLHFVLLAGKIGAFDAELEAQIAGDDVKARLRRQLPSNIFVQSLAGPHEERTGIIGFLLRLIGRISLVAGPIALLVLFQLQFLPYHNEPITMWQRAAVVIDLGLLWILWPPIERGETARLRWNDLKRAKVLAWMAASILPVLLVWTIATFPGEWLERSLPSVRLVPMSWAAWTLPSVEAIQKAGSGWATLHELLVAGEVNYVTGKPNSLWSNVLVLPNFEVGDRVKFDAEGKIGISSDTLSLRGRSLEGAVLLNAHLRKADFTAAFLAHADFLLADLREAKFGCDRVGSGRICAQLQGATLAYTQLQGAWLQEARLGGASLFEAHLEGAALGEAGLQGGALVDTQLQGADLSSAQLQGADLRNAELQGASLQSAGLQAALLDDAQLQGADLSSAQLQDASLNQAFVWRTKPPSESGVKGALIRSSETRAKYAGLDCLPPRPSAQNSDGSAEKGPYCDWSEAYYAALKSLIERHVPEGDRRDRALKSIDPLGQPLYIEDEVSAKGWRDLEKFSPSPEAYRKRVADGLKTIGCNANGAPYVMAGLIRQLDNRFFWGSSVLEATVAAAFLDEAHCPGARGLSEEKKARLQQMLQWAPAPPSPTAPGSSGRP